MKGRALSFYAVAAFAFLCLPLLILGVFSFNRSRFTIWEGFSLRWYQSVFTNPQLSDAAWNSILIAVAATAIRRGASVTLCGSTAKCHCGIAIPSVASRFLAWASRCLATRLIS